MASGVVRLIIPPWKEVFAWLLFVSVVFQEVARALLFYLFLVLVQTNEAAEIFIRQGYSNELLTGFTVGNGFAAMSVLAIFVPVITDGFWNDTSIYTDKCSMNYFTASAAFSMGYSLLHMLLAVYVWPAYSKSSWIRIIITFAVHLMFAELSLLNLQKEGCFKALPLILSLIFVFGLFVAFQDKVRKIKDWP